MIPPALDVDAAIIHVATVLIEQGYKPHDAYRAAQRIVYKCAIACTSNPLPAKLEETATLLKTFRPTDAS